VDRRKELKRAYLEAGTIAGVYCIRNIVNGRIYVDASPNAQGMLNRHRFDLDLGSHRNHALQQDWNENGKDKFEFEILDVLKNEDLVDANVAAELAALKELWREKLSAPPSNSPLY
jgi:hypothetical protein